MTRRIELAVEVRDDSKLDGPLLKEIIQALPTWYEDIVAVEVLMWQSPHE